MVLRSNKRIAPGTVASVIRAFIASPAHTLKAENTRKMREYYLADAERPEVLGAIDVNDLTTAQVEAWVNSFDTSATQTNALAAIRVMGKWAIKHQMLVPIVFDCDFEKHEGGHTPWTEKQIAYAIANCRPAYARVIALAAYTGQRCSDVVQMRWSSIEQECGYDLFHVVQVKTGVECWPPVVSELAGIMATRPSDAEIRLNPNLDFICLKDDGQPWGESQVNTNWCKIERPRHAELEGLRLHGLRGSCCVRMRRAGATDSDIGQTIGMSVPMVSRYTRKCDKRGGSVAMLQRLNGGSGRRQAA